MGKLMEKILNDEIKTKNGIYASKVFKIDDETAVTLGVSSFPFGKGVSLFVSLDSNNPYDVLVKKVKEFREYLQDNYLANSVKIILGKSMMESETNALSFWQVRITSGNILIPDELVDISKDFIKELKTNFQTVNKEFFEDFFRSSIESVVENPVTLDNVKNVSGGFMYLQELSKQENANIVFFITEDFKNTIRIEPDKAFFRKKLDGLFYDDVKQYKPTQEKVFLMVNNIGLLACRPFEEGEDFKEVYHEFKEVDYTKKDLGRDLI